jgi:hypothetical protein
VEVLPVKTCLALLALVISLLSLALQLRGQKPVSPLGKFVVPAQISELDRRKERVDIFLIRSSAPMNDGISIPFIREITADNQHIIVRAIVSEKYLPKTYDERKKALLSTAEMAVAAVASEFDLNFSSATDVVTVQFISMSQADTTKPYAEYRGGDLTFH